MRKPLVALAVVAAVPMTANAQMRAASLPDIYESYNDCFTATASGTDPDKLVSRGWARATADGHAAAGPAIYAHAARAPMILLGGRGDSGMCTVVAKLADAAAFDELIGAWQGIRFNKQGEANFFAEGHPVIVTKTGTRDAPSVRIAVGPRIERN